ncbi:MAG: UDP-glucose 4-epimerase GalE [Desulfuromonadales bacterium]
MNNILVTGGAGYIGSHCCKQLRLEGYNPVVFDNLVHGHIENVKWGEFYKGDVGSAADLEDCISKFDIKAVIHFAAFAYVGESVSNPMKYYNNNLRNTLNLLDCLVRCNIKHIIFSSTCATYGNPLVVPIDEKHPQNPINPYGQTKLMVEKILQDYDHAYSLKYICLRYFNAAGADPAGEVGENHDPETHLIPLVLDVAQGKSENIKVFGCDYDTIDGTCIRDYIHVMDLATAHTLALSHLLKEGRSASYNLGTGKGISVLEIIDAAARITGKEIPRKIEARRLGDPPVLIADNKKIYNELNWKPANSNINQIISDAWRWHTL